MRKGLLQKGDGDSCNKKAALNRKICKHLKSWGFSFLDRSKKDQKELGVGKPDERVEGLIEQRMFYPEASLFSGGAVRWLRLRLAEGERLKQSLVNEHFVLRDQR